MPDPYPLDPALVTMPIRVADMALVAAAIPGPHRQALVVSAVPSPAMQSLWELIATSNIHFSALQEG